MNKKTILNVFSTLALLLILAGCFRVERSYSEKRYFVLDVSRQREVSSAVKGAVLLIHKFRVSPRYDGKGFVYRLGDLTYESDYYNKFFISPGSLLAEEVRKWLARSGLFEHVVESPRAVEPAYILEGEVMTLYGDYSEGATPKAVLGIDLMLIRDASDGSKIVLQKHYHEEVPLKANTPEALIEGWNKALQHILTGFERDLRVKALKKKL